MIADNNHPLQPRLTIQEIEAEQDLKIKYSKIQRFAQQCRLDVFEMLYKRGNGHWGGSASAAELLASLYCHLMNVYPGQPNHPDRDRLVLSKGHAAPMLYTILAEKGFMPVEELSTFRSLNSRLQGHPCMNKTPGVDMSTGPLGHGISVGVGMASAGRLLNKQYTTYVIVGDGCLNEGQSWEGVMSAAKFKPPRLVIMVDYNRVQLDGSSKEIMPMDDIQEKFRSFNLNVSDKVYDGHSVTEIMESMEWSRKNEAEPTVIIYNTHKGKGISFMEDNHKWHGSPIDDESYVKGKEELLLTMKKLSV
jgi:transketolase